MFNVNIQLFAHKRVLVLPRTAVIPNPSVWDPSVPTVNLFWPVTFSFVNAVPTFTPVTTLAAVLMILCSLSSTAK